MEETQENQSTNPNVGFPPATAPLNNQPKKNWKWLVILIVFLIVIGGVTFFVFRSSSGADVEGSPTPDTSSLTNIATPASTPTAAPVAVDKADIKIEVLNGTGIAGEAGLLADALEELGYEGIDTGNATTEDATETEVTFSSNVDSSIVNEITTKLRSMYTAVTEGTATLVSGVDIQIITGVRKGQTATSTATPTPTATP